MGKAVRPVSINGLEFDALISEDRSFEASIPSFVVENGFPVSDTIITNPETLAMTLFVTDTPVTWRNHGGVGWTEHICSLLEEIFFSRTLVTIVTSDRTYRNMAIESLGLSKNIDTGYAREIPISFKQVRMTTAKTTFLPSYYGKSGDSMEPAGTANTGKGEAETSADSDGQTKSSILYSAGKSLGIV